MEPKSFNIRYCLTVVQENSEGIQASRVEKDAVEPFIPGGGMDVSIDGFIGTTLTTVYDNNNKKFYVDFEELKLNDKHDYDEVIGNFISWGWEKM